MVFEKGKGIDFVVPVPKEAETGFEIGLQDLKYGLEAELNARIVNKRRRRF